MLFFDHFFSAPPLVKPLFDGRMPGEFMSDGENLELQLRERIAKLMQSVGGSGKKVSEQERETLKGAVGRLDQLLKSAALADQEALKTAAVRLDQLLSDIRRGKDVTSALKRKGEE